MSIHKYRVKYRLLRKYPFDIFAVSLLGIIGIIFLFVLNSLSLESYVSAITMDPSDPTFANRCASYNPQASLVVTRTEDNDEDAPTKAGYNSIALRNYEVTAKTCNAFSYSLGIQGDNELKTASGDTIVAVNKDGTTLASDSKEDTWGYYYDAEGGAKGSEEDEYNNFLIYAQYSVGRWKTPDNKIIDSGIIYMQDINKTVIDGGFCGTKIPTGSTIILIDSRNSEQYAIIKATNQCLMAKNLNFIGSISTINSNSGTNFVITEDCNGYNSSDVETVKACSSGSIAQSSNNGVYYNWYTATAKSGTQGMVNNEADFSICPKNWKMPSKNEWEELISAIGNMPSAWTSQPYSFVRGGYLVDGSIVGNTGYYWSRSVVNDDAAYTLRIDNNMTRIHETISKYAGAFVRCVADSQTTSSGSISGNQSLLGDIDTPVTAFGYKELEQGNGDATGETKNLTFAVKFGDNAAAGEYSADIKLLLVATPKAVAIGFGEGGNHIENMQDMTPEVCNSVTPGTTGELYDTRDWKIYSVQRFQDGSCWMTQNLALDINNVIIASDNTNTSVTNAKSLSDIDFTALNDEYDRRISTKNWDDTQTARRYAVLPNETERYSGNGDVNYQTEFGYYYSWCAATLGCAGASGKTGKDLEIQGEDTVSSVCPKGWKLPSMHGTVVADSDFSKAFGGIISNDSTETHNKFFNTSGHIPGYMLDIANNVQWPAAGYIALNGLEYSGTDGYYWSSTAYISNAAAYGLYFYSDRFSPGDHNGRYAGGSVRCLAQGYDYELKYDANGGAGAPDTQKANSMSQSYDFTISSIEPTREGYTFQGWADTQVEANAGTVRYAAGTGKATLTSTNPTKTIYAVWKANCTNTISGTMQSALPAASYCEGATGTMTDNRGGATKSYGVKRLTLNSTATLWMTENLKLEPGTPLTTSDSNVKSNDYSIPANTNSSSTWKDDYCKAYMAIAGGEYYYNWPAATARKASSNTSSCTTDTADTGDICPAGWRLPEYNEINSSDKRGNLVTDGNLTTTGFFYSGTRNFVGSYGYWWTSTRDSGVNANYFYLNGSTASSGYSLKLYGSSVRCMRTS